jgi:hypothetical protein
MPEPERVSGRPRSEASAVWRLSACARCARVLDRDRDSSRSIARRNPREDVHRISPSLLYPAGRGRKRDSDSRSHSRVTARARSSAAVALLPVHRRIERGQAGLAVANEDLERAIVHTSLEVGLGEVPTSGHRFVETWPLSMAIRAVARATARQIQAPDLRRRGPRERRHAPQESIERVRVGDVGRHTAQGAEPREPATDSRHPFFVGVRSQQVRAAEVRRTRIERRRVGAISGPGLPMTTGTIDDVERPPLLDLLGIALVRVGDGRTREEQRATAANRSRRFRAIIESYVRC